MVDVKPPPEPKAPPCPICRKPAQQKFRPFCSARCADIDLGRWFTESYTVPAVPDAEDGADDDLTG